MKNRKLLNIIYILVIIIIICFFYLYKYKNTIISSIIYDKTWYSYNTTNGYYDTFIINDKKIQYNKIDDIEYSTCSRYNYNKKNNSFVLDCNKEIIIDEISDSKLVLIIDGKKKTFFNNINDTLNTEFNSYYSKSISEFKKDMNRVIDLIKIENEDIKDLLIDNEYSKFVFLGDKCSSIECSISLSNVEKWITNTENIYYIDSSSLDESTINDLNSVDDNFKLELNYYNDIYPLVIITNNGKIIDSYNIKCNGFNCDKYNENEF